MDFVFMDAVLRYLSDSQQSFSAITDNVNPSYKYEHAKAAIEYLCEEQYIKKESPKESPTMYSVFSIQQKGLTLLKNGGFEKQEQIRLLDEQNKISREALEQRQIRSNIDTNNVSRKANIWSPIFAGLAALMAIISFILQILPSNRQEKKIEQLRTQLQTKDSLLKIQQTQIDSLLIKAVHRDNEPKSDKDATNKS